MALIERPHGPLKHQALRWGHDLWPDEWRLARCNGPLAVDVAGMPVIQIFLFCWAVWRL